MTIKVSRQPLSVLWRSVVALRRRELWLLLTATAGAGLLIWYLSKPLIQLLGQAAEARLWILSFGALAPVVYVSVFAVQILLAPIPGQFLGVMGGYLFGMLWGSVYSITGMTLGAGLAMFLGRRFGRPFLERFFGVAELRRWERKLRMRSPITWWLLFLFPLPDIVFYAAGLSTVPLRWLLLALITGRGLGLVFANLLGYWSAHMQPEWVLVKWTVLFLLGGLIYLYQRRIRLLILISTRNVRRLMRRRSRKLVPDS